MKRRPSYSLAAFQRVCGRADRLTATRKAMTSAIELGFTRAGMAEVVRSMKPRHFYKSMTSYVDHREWQDVYHVPTDAGVVYLKFKGDVVSEFLILSFKEKQDG